MLMLSERLDAARSADASLELPFELRSRSRFRAHLSTGDEVGVKLNRGQVLRGGDLLLASDGRVVEVRAAAETVSTVHSTNARALARAAYHLGNRHIALQLGEGWLRYAHDHVLDELIHGLGLVVQVSEAPFEPEGGAYQGGGAAHAHTQPHAHEHGHGH
jgi:urease accessory protein